MARLNSAIVWHLRDPIEWNRNVETVLDVHDEIQDRHGVQPQAAHYLRFGRTRDASGNPSSEQLYDLRLDVGGVVGQVTYLSCESAGCKPAPIPVPAHGVTETLGKSDCGAPQIARRLALQPWSPSRDEESRQAFSGVNMGVRRRTRAAAWLIAAAARTAGPGKGMTSALESMAVSTVPTISSQE